MWLLDWFKKKPEPMPVSTRSYTWEDVTRMLNLGSMTRSGVSVGEDTALTIPAVYACIRAIAEPLAAMPLKLYRKEGPAVFEADEEELYWLIYQQPSDIYTSYQFRQTLQYHACLRGNAYARIYRNRFGQAVDLRIMHPDYVTPRIVNNKLYYEVREHGSFKKELLADFDVLHIAAIGADGILGKAPLTLLRETMGLHVANRDYVQAIQKNGGRLRGYLKHPQKLSKEQVEAIRANFKSPLLSGEFPVLENGLEFEAISLTPIDLEFIKTAQITIEDIARAFKVPLHMINVMAQSTFSNMEQQALEFHQNTLLPWIKNWEQALFKLIPPSKRRTYFFRFNPDYILRADFMTRMKGYQLAISTGLMTINEARALENLNPVEGGDVNLTPLNLGIVNNQPIEIEQDGQ
jgi:HK97 family phage portal protein